MESSKGGTSLENAQLEISRSTCEEHLTSKKTIALSFSGSETKLGQIPLAI